MKYVRSLCQRSAGTGVFFRFESIVRRYHVYKGALNKKYFDNRIKPAPNSEYVLISEVRLTTREYGMTSYRRALDVRLCVFPLSKNQLKYLQCNTIRYYVDYMNIVGNGLVLYYSYDNHVLWSDFAIT